MAVHQQKDDDQAKSRDYLDKQEKKGAQAGVIFREHHARDFNQPDFVAEAGDAHIDEREKVGEQQHEQGCQRVTDGTLPRRVPLGCQRRTATWTQGFMSVTKLWQRHQHIALRAQHQVILVLRRRYGMTMLLMIVVGTHHIPPQ